MHVSMDGPLVATVGRSVAHVRDELHIRATFSVMRKFNCVTFPMQSAGFAYVFGIFRCTHILIH